MNHSYPSKRAIYNYVVKQAQLTSKNKCIYLHIFNLELLLHSTFIQQTNIFMKYTKEAVHSLSYLTQDSNEKIATDCSSNSNSNSSCTNVESTPIYQALKGYSLYKHHEKLAAIVNFLRISSHNPISISGDPSIIAKLDTICKTPELLLKGMKGCSKYPIKWNLSVMRLKWLKKIEGWVKPR